jgi:hypothetical protein
MKLTPLVSLTFLSLSLYGAMGSSISVPPQEHLKYTFGNHKNHPVQKMEERQYYKSIAPMKEEEIRNHLSSKGYSVRDIKLSDIASELVYQVWVRDTTSKSLKLYVDPANGSILKTEPIQ